MALVVCGYPQGKREWEEENVIIFATRGWFFQVNLVEKLLTLFSFTLFFYQGSMNLSDYQFEGERIFL